MHQKSLEAKKNHHYVWAHYMLRWSCDNKNVWHTTQTGKVILGSVRGFSKEDYFYKAIELTPDHVHIIKHWSSRSPTYLQEQHMKLLSEFLEIQKRGVIYRAGSVKNQTVDDTFHALSCNMMEDRHSIHENDARPIMDALVSGDISVLDNNENLLKFIVFFGHQTSRTKSFRELFSLVPSISRKQGNEAENICSLIEDCGWFLSYMLGINIGASLYSSKIDDNHCLLINNTKTSFITSDEPIINVHQSLKEGEVVPPGDDECDFFYPLSPGIAYMINRSDRFPKGVTEISEEFAKEMNIRIAKASKTYIVGINRETVALYKNHVGKRKAIVRNHFAQ